VIKNKGIAVTIKPVAELMFARASRNGGKTVSAPKNQISTNT
jgi:hypothetical protein